MKEEQKKLITEIMNDDAKDGLYDHNVGLNKMVTAVDWLVEQIKSDQNQKALSATEWIEVIEQAKQMEKEQMEAAWNNGYKSCKDDIVSDTMTTFEQYITSTP